MAEFDSFEFLLEMRDEASKKMEAASTQVRRLRKDLRTLAAGQGEALSVSKRLTAAMEKQARAATSAANAQAKNAASTKKLSKDQQRMVQAQRGVLRAINDTNVADIKRIKTSKITRIETRKRAGVLRVEEEALVKARIAARAKLGEDKRLIAVAAAERAASRQKTRSLAVEAEAQLRLAAAKRKTAVASRLAAAAAAEGIDPRTGAALQQGPPVPANIARQHRAQRQFEQELERTRTQQEVKNLRKQSAEYQQLTKKTEKATGATRRMAKEQKGLNAAVNRVSFTFRRLFGILAAFAAARAAIAGFAALIRDSVQFNARLEQAQLGVRAVLVAVGNVSDSMGGAVDKSEQFARSTALAREQTEKLRFEAQKTAATFDQLVETFQVAIAPGITSGLKLDEVREFTVRISQAASALGVQQNQLVEEIRSILEGTIQKRTTRIASALGITNEDIRRAKEMGDLAEFLDVRFQAFALAGEESLTNFNAIITNTRDALLQLTGAGGLEFFEELKDLLLNIKDSFQTKDDDGFLKPNPRAEKVIGAIFDGLERAVQEADRLRDSLEFRDLLVAATAIGDVFAAIPILLSGVIEGLVQGIGNVASLVQDLGNALSKLTGFEIDTSSVQKFVALAAEVLTTWLGISFIISGIRGLLSPIVGSIRLIANSGKLIGKAWGGIAALFSTVAAVIGALSIKLILVGVIVAELALRAKDWLDELTGVELKFTSVLKIIKVSLVAAWDFAMASMRLSWVGLSSVIVEGLRSTAALILTTLILPLEGTLYLLGQISDIAANASENLAKIRSDINANAAAGIKNAQKELDEATQSFVDAKEALTTGLAEEIKVIAANNENEQTFTELFKGALGAAFSSFKDLTSFDLGLGFDDVNAEALTLGKLFSGFSGAIERANQELTVSAKIMRGLEIEARDLQTELDFSAGTSGLVASAKQATTEITRAKIREGRITEEINNKILANLKTQRALASRGYTLEARKQNLTAEELDTFNELLAGAEGINKLESRRLELLQSTRTLTAEIVDANRRGQDDLEEALKKRKAAEEAALAATKETLQGLLATLDGVTIEDLPAEQQKVLELVKQQVQITAESNVALREGQQLEEGRAAATAAVNKELGLRLALMRQERDLLVEQEVARDNSAAQFQRVLNVASLTRNAAAKEYAQRAVSLGQARQEYQLTAQRYDQSLEALKARRDEVGEGKAREEIEKSILEIEKRQAAELGKIGAEIEAAGIDLAEQQRFMEGGLGGGLIAGISEWANNAPLEFQRGIDTMSSIIESFSAFASKLIVDAFDPTADIDLQERFGRFFQGIAQMLLDQFIQAKLAKLLQTNISEGLRQATDAAGGAAEGATEGAALTGGATAAAGVLEAGALASGEVLVIGAVGAAEALEVGAAAAAVSISGGATAVGTAATAIGGAATGMGTAAGVLASAVTGLGPAAGTLGVSASTLATTIPGLVAAASELAAAAVALAVAGAAGGGSPIGAAGGGLVPRRVPKRHRGHVSPSHHTPRARGLAGGGRPPWVPLSDTIPAWLTPGEWVMKLGAVRRYGADVMNAINAGKVDPSALRGLVSTAAASGSVRSPRYPAFAEGGLASEQQAKDQRATNEASPSDAGGAVPVLAIDDRLMGQLLAGGGSALVRWTRDNDSTMRAALGLERGMS